MLESVRQTDRQSVSQYILGAHKTVTPKAENVINLTAPNLSERFLHPFSCLCTEQKGERGFLRWRTGSAVNPLRN